MTDRELLEMAAKAAGLAFWHENGWNPLEDDGDAFRLAVKLEITLSHYGATHVCETATGRALADEVDTTGDGYAATRRAIVRAAAEIGKKLP